MHCNIVNAKTQYYELTDIFVGYTIYKFIESDTIKVISWRLKAEVKKSKALH